MTLLSKLAAELQASQLAWNSRPQAWQPRPEQVPPHGEWRTFLFLAGRGAGKTRAAAEWVHERASTPQTRIAVVARTAADARDVCVEGESGILATAPPWRKPLYEPSKRRLSWPNGSQATVFSADEPDLLRGPQFHYCWADELAAWNRLEDTWSNLDMGLRLGTHPQVFVSTTPRPLPLIRRLMADQRSIVVRGRTVDNLHLPASAIEALKARYGGTRLGRQELEGEILDDAPGALWRREWIEDARVEAAPELTRVVVAVDPAVTATEDSDETGVVVVGVSRAGDLYVLADYSGRLPVEQWAAKAISAYQLHQADAIVVETNQGGDMARSILRQVHRSVPITEVRASRGKQTRAGPVALRYEQGRVHHVGRLDALEDQLVTWDPMSGSSPDRLDALVWGCTSLLGLIDDSPPEPPPLPLEDEYEQRAMDDERRRREDPWGLWRR